MLLGLLTYKPHLGLMFPIALAASGHWRVFVTAMIVAALMALASLLAFGVDSWQAFFANISHTSHVFLSEGQADLSKLQTAFGLTRTLGGSEALAWTVQIALGLAAAGVIAMLWHSRVADEIKCAALGIATMLATPYLYTYDLVVLAVPLAFLIRLGGKRGFLPHEVAGIGLACALSLSSPSSKNRSASSPCWSSGADCAARACGIAFAGCPPSRLISLTRAGGSDSMDFLRACSTIMPGPGGTRRGHDIAAFKS